MSMPTTTLTIAATKTAPAAMSLAALATWAAVGHGQVYGSFYGGVDHFGAYEPDRSRTREEPIPWPKVQ